MTDWLSRTRILIGDSGIKKLSESSVAVFGLGGVGSFAAEALARSGVGRIIVFDGDVIEASNINRQLIAATDNIGLNKAYAVKDRISKINPSAEVQANACFYTRENADRFNFTDYNYIIDAIDMVSAKLEIISRAYKEKIPIISAMGTGNKLNPLKLEVDDIYSTSVCPLARVMRRELRKREVGRLKTVYSKEEPVKGTYHDNKESAICSGAILKREIPGSISFVPSVAGLIMAGETIKDIIDI